MIRGLGSVETIRFDSRIRFSGLSKCCLNFAYEDLFHTVSFRIEALSLTVRLESLASQLHGEGECSAPPIYFLLKKIDCFKFWATVPSSIIDVNKFHERNSRKLRV